jgi:hypothetical protein
LVRNDAEEAAGALGWFVFSQNSLKMSLVDIVLLYRIEIEGKK